MRKGSQPKWGKIERGYFHWSTNTRHYKDKYFNKLLQGDEKAACDSFKFVVKVFLGNRRAQNYDEHVNNRLQRYQKLGCNMSLKIHPSLAFGFFPVELWCSEWWTWRAFPSRHFFSGEEISREMELCYARRLLLDFGKGFPYYGIQVAGKTGGGVILFVLNNELTWKRLCRCSIYIVNSIPKQNNSAKHILFHWIVFSFLFKPLFRVIFQPIS